MYHTIVCYTARLPLLTSVGMLIIFFFNAFTVTAFVSEYLIILSRHLILSGNFSASVCTFCCSKSQKTVDFEPLMADEWKFQKFTLILCHGQLHQICGQLYEVSPSLFSILTLISGQSEDMEARNTAARLR